MGLGKLTSCPLALKTSSWIVDRQTHIAQEPCSQALVSVRSGYQASDRTYSSPYVEDQLAQRQHTNYRWPV